jgi:hypothetical protein
MSIARTSPSKTSLPLTTTKECHSSAASDDVIAIKTR